LFLNKVFTSLFFIMLLFALVSVTACKNEQEKDSNVVAQIADDYVITFNDLRKFVFDRLYHKQYRDITESYNQALDVMITNQLKVKDFFETNFDKNQELTHSIKRIINEELIVEYFKTQFLGKYTSDEFVQKIYNNMGRQVFYRQIVLYKPAKVSQQQIDSLKIQSLKIKAEIDENKDFNQLVKQYSQHSESINSNGYMPPVGWDQSVSNAIDNIIYDLNIGDVRILEAHNAFQIVKVTNIKEVDVEPYDKIKDDIKDKLNKNYYNKSLDEYDTAKEILVDPATFKWNDQALNQLVKWSGIRNFYIDIYKDTLQRAISNGKNLVLATYPDGQVDFEEYLRLLNTVLIPKNTQNISKKDTEKFIIEAMRSDLVIKKARELDLEKNIFNARTNNMVLRTQITKLYDGNVIESQIPGPAPEALHKFYESQKDSLYYHLKKINIYVMIFPEKNKADEVMQRISNGTPFEKISGRWLVKTFVRDRNGNIKLYRSPQQHYLGEAAFELEEKETSGPIEYVDPEKGKQYAIIKCVHIRPEKQLLFDDVKNTIAEDFVKYQREKRTREVRETLWKKYNIKIYKDVLSEKLTSGN